MHKEKKIAIFDLDGTLLQTHLYSPVCNREALKHFGVDHVDEEKLIASIGHPFHDFISVFLPDFPKEDIPKYFEILLEQDQKYIPTLAKLFDGVRESLLALRNDGWTTAICTNSDGKYVRLIDDTVHISHLMDEIVTLDTRESKSESLRYLLNLYPDHTGVMVGDSKYDKIAADDCGLPFVGCLYGYAPNEMSSCNADALVDHGSKLYTALNELSLS